MNPYFIQGPALISFSGGRTSAFMLWNIIQAHGGTLPDDVVVAFANTGKEREETLRFVHECGARWGVRVHWVEWRREQPGFEIVGFNSASRDGEPFKALIDWKQRLPNWQERWCTEYLKVRPMHRLMSYLLGAEVGGFEEVVGLRHDEGVRILRGYERAEKDGRSISYPLAKAKITKPDVLSWWKVQPFDLALEPWGSNCDPAS
jgi:3'-phosphoadenosine 5'-phosphosulfate sulfotransferase (PAPS reductase)/FAD synthetase